MSQWAVTAGSFLESFDTGAWLTAWQQDTPAARIRDAFLICHVTNQDEG